MKRPQIKRETGRRRKEASHAMSQGQERFLNYSQLLSELVDGRGRTLNDTTVAFLYQLFPNDLFVKAFSLLETHNLFLYVWDSIDDVALNDGVQCSDAEIDETSNSVAGSRLPTEGHQCHSKRNSNDNDISRLANMLYDLETRSKTLHRIIVQSVDEEVSKKPIYVDVTAWFCSCNEYTKCFSGMLHNNGDEGYQGMFETYGNETDDNFAKVNSHTHVNSSKVICQHLLAAAILLQTSLKVLKYFTSVKQSVSLFSINNKDDWLKLHLNIVD